LDVIYDNVEGENMLKEKVNGFFNCPSKQANKMKLANQKVTCT
jgi:hypothetical protein